ncbi:MAG: carboxypeptidase regulatory-like domain-containing protein [Candidatus Bruticola sp.]
MKMLSGLPKPKASYLVVLLAVFLLSCLMSCKATAQAVSQETPPPLPSMPPPIINYSLQTAPPAVGKANSISTTAGWQIISFPVKKVDSVWGLKRMLYKISGISYIPIDPVNNPQSLEPGIAYITYADSPCTIYFTSSQPASQCLATNLKPGWNLVGLPSMKAVSDQLSTLTNLSGQTIVPLDLKERSSWPQRTWISSHGGTFVNGQWTKTGKALNNLVNPGQIFAICCREPLLLNWNIDLPAQNFPEITQITPSSPATGDIVFIKGLRLGSRDTGTVSIAGMPLPSNCILDWQPTYIKFKVPQGISSGSLRVSVKGCPSSANLIAFSTEKTNLSKANTTSASSKATGSYPATVKSTATTKNSQVASSQKTNKQASASVKKLNSIDDQIASIEHDIGNTSKSKFGAPSSTKTKQVKAVSPGEASFEAQQHRQNNKMAKAALPTDDDDANFLLSGGLPSLTGNSSLAGEVVSSNGRPIKRARVTLSSGQRALTNAAGQFSINNVPSDRQIRISVSKNGYNTGKGKIAINAGQTKKVKVELSPKESATEATGNSKEVRQTGNFVVKAESMRVGPRERRLYVYKIEVTQEGDLSKHWQNTWWDDTGNAYVELRCDDANLNESYNITITWKSRGRHAREVSDKWSKKFTAKDQTFTFSHP